MIYATGPRTSQNMEQVYLHHWNIKQMCLHYWNIKQVTCITKRETGPQASVIHGTVPRHHWNRSTYITQTCNRYMCIAGTWGRSLHRKRSTHIKGIWKRWECCQNVLKIAHFVTSITIEKKQTQAVLKSDRQEIYKTDTSLLLTWGGCGTIAWCSHPTVLLTRHSHTQQSLPTLRPTPHTLLHIAGVKHMLHAAWQQPTLYATRLQPRFLHSQFHAAAGHAAGGGTAAEDPLEVDKHRWAEVTCPLQASRDLGEVLEAKTSGVGLLQQKVVAFILTAQRGRARESFHLGVYRHLNVHEVVLQGWAEVRPLPSWGEVRVEGRGLGPILFLLGLLCVRWSHDSAKRASFSKIYSLGFTAPDLRKNCML